MRALAALAIFCTVSLFANAFLAWRLSSAVDEVERLESTVTNLRAARQADSLAQSLRDKLYREAEDNAQAKYNALESIPDGLSDADWLDAVRYGLRSKGGDGGTDTAGKPDAANATPGTAGSAHAN
ncbi:MAG: hypothetical protein RBR41_03185 [Desulfovibrio sp.]|uniref:hypothetical protein n=1 Tax=Desulfovibrio sp. TaxID=885 RepID=UPI002A35F317|nr:hypothetical protein [Desulfovibrio sp.]MDY0258655.1 hypothetical protein [Desulfovibrio sp.]